MPDAIIRPAITQIPVNNRFLIVISRGKSASGEPLCFHGVVYSHPSRDCNSAAPVAVLCRRRTANRPHTDWRCRFLGLPTGAPDGTPKNTQIGCPKMAC